ncbi:LysR family transcriptional regulator [Sphingomonas echinoides]|uniref:LysR family transcriptional regulator n=1 Tax=Sphingomonas echinoides TaxID=59803 RepID=UPI0024133380|nr:LysR family transcriptional regulator [Sphingomonas echinoides]
MDIRELRTFSTVAYTGSFSRAAEKLRIAQPALSRHVAKLEEELKVALFVRHARGVVLTPAGARLLDRAEMMLHYLNGTSEYVRDDDPQERGHLAVGLTPAIGLAVGANMVRRFRARWPKAMLHVREGLSTSLQAWLLDGSVQAAVVYNQPLLEAFEVRPLFSEPMVLVAPPGEAPRTLRFVDLADLPLILPALPHSNRRLIEQMATQNGVRLRVIMEIDSVALTRQLVADGLGYSITAQLAIQPAVDAGIVTSHQIERPSLRSHVGVATLRELRDSPLAGSWVEILTDELRTLALDGAWKGKAIWGDD